MELRVDGVGYRIGTTDILRGIDLDLPSGAVTGLLGPNGAGKTTLLRVVAGLLQPSAGSVLLDGVDVRAGSARQRAQTIALLEQDATASVPMTVLDVVLLGRIPHRGRWAGPGGPEDRALAMDCLRDAGADHLAARSWGTLSGGERQRVHIARALAQAPRLLLLDEPTNHLDVAAQLSLLDLVSTLDLTVVAALHDLNLAAAFCDRVVLLDRGRVAAQGTPEQVLTPATIRDVYGVDAVVLTHPATARPVITFTPHRSRRTDPSTAPSTDPSPPSPIAEM